MSRTIRAVCALAGLAVLGACASTLPNGAAPVSSLYSFNDTARFMLRDMCLPAVVEGTPLAQLANVPAVYPVEGASRPSWRAGPGGAVQVTQTGPRACTVTVTRGIPEDLRNAMIREVENSRSDFRLVDSTTRGRVITDTFCAPFPSGLSVRMTTDTSEPAASILVTADAAIREDLCL